MNEAGGAPVVVAEQRVDRGRRGQQPVGGAEHHDDVGVEPGGAGDRPDGDAGADPAEPAGRDVELGGEHGSELAAGGRRADRVEVAEPVEHADGVLVGLVLGFARAVDDACAEPALDLVDGPVGPLAPGAGGGGPAEVAAQLGDELDERIGRVGAGRHRRPAVGIVVVGPALLGPATLPGGERAQARGPVLVADDTGLAADALPLRGRHGVAGAVAHGQVGEQVEQVAAAQPAAVDVEQVEQEARDQRAR